MRVCAAGGGCTRSETSPLTDGGVWDPPRQKGGGGGGGGAAFDVQWLARSDPTPAKHCNSYHSALIHPRGAVRSQ